MPFKYEIHEAHDLDYRVHFVLSRNSYVSGKDVQYEIVDDNVVLKGSVKTYYQKQMAQESLRKVSGIRRITNELNVIRK